MITGRYDRVSGPGRPDSWPKNIQIQTILPVKVSVDSGIR